MVADAVIIASCDVRFDIVWRPTGGGDVTLASFMHHFDPNGPNPDGTPNFDAVPYEDSALAARADAQAGDRIVWRFTVSGTDRPTAFVPNGDGANTNGRIPFIELP